MRTREAILRLTEAALESVPPKREPDLPRGGHTSGTPKWYAFEHEIWAQGEELRQALANTPKLRRDPDIQAAILAVACNRNAKRGRQSFIMLLGYTCCAPHAAVVAEHLDDDCVAGHVIDTLLKMKCETFVVDVAPFVNHEVAWIRNTAKRYVARYGNR